MNLVCQNIKNCKSNKIKILYQSDQDNLDNLLHYHCECQDCGYQFNVWNCSIDKLAEVFGQNFRLYI